MSVDERYAAALSSFKNSTVLQDFSLTGKVIVVTGGASGIGLALSQAVVEVGGCVAAIGTAAEPEAEFFNVFGENVGSKVKYYNASIADEHAIEAGFASIRKDFGRIDGIIACAGICIEKPFLESTWNDVRSLHDVNSLGTFFSIQHAVQASAIGKGKRIIVGDDILDTSGSTIVSDEVATVDRILGPLTAAEVPVLRCVGLNYAKHIQQAKRTPPPNPFIFFKPTTTIVGHDDPVVIPKIAQDDQADYEGELVLVIGKDAKDVPRDKALDYVAAYTVGNDISSRKLQRNPELAGRIPQWGFSKGFDTYAPLGPCLVAKRLVDNPRNLHLRTTIDGEVRQDESISDMLFDSEAIISYLSQGTTLQKGSIIMTGTPGGVGGDMQPPSWLKPGTVMEVKISKIGTLRNAVEFA